MFNETPPPHVLQAAIAHWRATGATEWMPMRGYSMWPLLQPGDHIQVAFGKTLFQKHQLCVFTQNGQTIAHRVLGHDKNGAILTRGDHVLQFDEPVSSAEIYGLILTRKRHNRTIQFTTTYGKFYIYICLLIAQTHIHSVTLLRSLGLRRPQFLRKNR